MTQSCVIAPPGDIGTTPDSTLIQPQGHPRVSPPIIAVEEYRHTPFLAGPSGGLPSQKEGEVSSPFGDL